MARIPLDMAANGLVARLAAWYSKRRFGVVVEPLAAASHHRGFLVGWSIFELGAGRWRKLDPTLQCLAVYAPSAAIGCSWCLDFGYWEAHHRGVPPAKIRELARWRESDVYGEVERLVIEYAEALTATPPTVSDELVERLRRHLGDEALVELTALAALENLRSRFNASLGLQSQGFEARCELPPPVTA